MRVFSADYLKQVAIDIHTACGASDEEAAIVAEELIEASLMGLDSHGIIRCAQYAEQVLKGEIKPGAPIRIDRETPSTAIVDCGSNYGAVSAMRMLDIACGKAREVNISYVASLHSQHVGRLGSWPQKAAERGFFCIAGANGPKRFQRVVPWGGSEARICPNPLAFGAPTGTFPIVLDMSTSMISEGKVRSLMHQGKSVPPGRIQDADGNPTTNPKDLYGPPPGTIMPFGSELGYKGFGLALLVEIMCGIIVGLESSLDQAYHNGFCLIVINLEAFCGFRKFKEVMDDLCEYMKSTPPAPGFTEVVMPGEIDFRTRQERLSKGIPVAEDTWQDIVRIGKKVGVVLGEAAGKS